VAAAPTWLPRRMLASARRELFGAQRAAFFGYLWMARYTLWLFNIAMENDP